MREINIRSFAVRMNVFALAVMAASLTGIAVAQSPTKVGVIQIQAALTATKEGQKAAAELETKMSPRKKDLEGKQTEIKDLQDRLQKGGNTLSESAKEDLTRNIDAKTKSFNRDVEDAQAELEQEQQKIINTLGQKMMQVIDKYAQANGFAIVFDVSNQNTPVLYAANQVDITKEIIDLYDKTIFTPVPVGAPVRPAGAPPAAAPKPAAPKPPAAAPAKP
jgi:outer membrane protein